MRIYFSDFFDVDENTLDEYGALNVSLINDLPLFIDPFLLFNSKNAEYQRLHEQIITYMAFLRDKSSDFQLDSGLIASWYTFSEVEQNWLGFSKSGNKGHGLRTDFAMALHRNLNLVFADFGSEKVTRGSHLEKLCLINDGVGRDKISDFTTNLIKDFLLEYTQKFARQHIDPSLRKRVAVSKVRFNYNTETWESGVFELPYWRDDYVVLTPADILTKDDTWISKSDMYSNFIHIPLAIPNENLRAQINNYFLSMLPEQPSIAQRNDVITRTLRKFPQLLDYYIRMKEDDGDSAISASDIKVKIAKKQYIVQIGELAEILDQETEFYKTRGDTLSEALDRAKFLKDVIENKDGYRLFYIQGKPITREEDLQILYRLTWYATDMDVNREVNNGRGPVDYKVSRGSADTVLVEFKLASNTKLKRNLEKQVGIYQKASDSSRAVKVIIYFSSQQHSRVANILRELEMETDPYIVLIDACKDNKPSASKA